MSVRGCSEITLVQGFEQQRTQANISGWRSSGGTSGGTCWSGPALFYPFPGPLLPHGLTGFTQDDSSVTKFVSTVSTYDLIPAVSDILEFLNA